MDRTLPHFLRFTRALALVSGVAVLPGCGGEVEHGGENCGPNASCTVYDGGPTGTTVYDGSGGGTVAYDGSVMGTPPVPYDGSVTGTPGIDAGITAYDAGFPIYDSGPTGVPIYDAGADVAIVDAASDVFQGGGPLAPPDLPA
jgi:hypothetical protein